MTNRLNRCLLLLTALLVAALLYVLNDVGNSFPISDGGSHYVTGLLAYDWLHTPRLSNPIQFGTDYFKHLPYIGLLLWPPLFYGLEMIAFSIFGPSIHVSLMLVSAIFAAGAAVLGQATLKSGRSMLVAQFITATILTSALLQDVQRNLLIDGLVSVLSVAAVFQFAYYLVNPSWARAGVAGLLAVLAFYAKGNALQLGIALPLLAFMLRCPGMLIDRRTLVMAVGCIAATGPWLYLTAGLSAQGFLYSMTGPALMSLIGAHFHTIYVAMPILAFFSCIGALDALGRAVRFAEAFDPRGIFSAACTSIVIACIVFHTVIPAGSDPRYMLAAVFGAFGLAVLGLEIAFSWLLQRLRRQPDPRVVSVGVAAVLFAQAVAGLISPLQEIPKSVGPIAIAVMKVLPDNNRSVLISGDHNAETSVGPALAALDGARRASKDGVVVVRGSRVFAGGAYRNRDYQAKFQGEAAYRLELARLGVPVIVTVTPKSDEQWGHIATIQTLLSSGDSNYRKTAEQIFFRDQIITVWRLKEELTRPINFDVVSESNSLRERVSKVVN